MNIASWLASAYGGSNEHMLYEHILMDMGAQSLAIAGLAVGVRHAIDPDHVAAVASLAVRGDHRLAEAVRLATSWGIGHGLAIVTIGAAALMAGIRVPHELSPLLEGAVGVMLLALGISAIYARARVDTYDHARAAHAVRRRALLVGAVHGLAGSATLALVTAATVVSPLIGLTHLVLFAMGAIGGMAVLSLLLSLPLSCVRVREARRWMIATVGVGTASIGAWMLMRM